MASEVSIKILSEAHLDADVFCETFSQREDAYRWGIFLLGRIHAFIQKHTGAYATRCMQHTEAVFESIKIIVLPLFPMKS